MEDRQVERGSRLQLLVVHVAAHGTRLGRANPAPFLGRSHGHDAEERLERQFETPGHPADACLFVDVDMHAFVICEFVGQRTQKRQDRGEPPVLRRPGLKDIDLKHIARRGPFDEDRSRDHMRPRALVVLVVLHRGQMRGQDALAAGRQILGLAGGQAMQDYLVARRDMRHGFARRVEVAPEDILGRPVDFVRSHSFPLSLMFQTVRSFSTSSWSIDAPAPDLTTRPRSRTT